MEQKRLIVVTMFDCTLPYSCHPSMHCLQITYHISCNKKYCKLFFVKETISVKKVETDVGNFVSFYAPQKSDHIQSIREGDKNEEKL